MVWTRIQFNQIGSKSLHALYPYQALLYLEPDRAQGRLWIYMYPPFTRIINRGLL